MGGHQPRRGDREDLDELTAWAPTVEPIIDMGPGGGTSGGRIIASGTPHQVARDPGSVTGRFLRDHLELADTTIA